MKINFASKEQYLEFRAAWKQFHKEGRHLPKPHPIEYFNWDTSKVEIVGYSKESDLHVEHHLLYAILRGRNPFLGFAPKKLDTADISRTYCKNPFWTLFLAAHRLEGRLQCISKKLWRPEVIARELEYISRPFGNTLTDDLMIQAHDSLVEWRKISNFWREMAEPLPKQAS